MTTALGTSGAEPTIRLWHGTTRRRAEAILKDGPNPDFAEPSGTKALLFAATRATGPFHHGHPAEYAKKKDSLFAEGGAAIVEVEVPASIVALALDFLAEVEFWPGIGLEELLAAWPTLSKRTLDVNP